MYFQVASNRWKPTSKTREYDHTNRKRKHQELEEKIDLNTNHSNSDNEIPIAGPSHDPNLHQIPILTLDEIAQYRVAGQTLTEPLPAAPFPHTYQSRKRQEVEQERGSQAHPQYPSSAVDKKQVLLQHHLSSLTTVLHRCLLQRDFLRARRALGLILRTHTGGFAFDIRNGAFWGVGGELLLRNTPNPISDLPAIPRGYGDDEEANDSGVLFTPEISRRNLEMVKRYLESLSVLHTYHTVYPRVTSAVDFKLALMELWIYFLQDQVKRIDRAPTSGPSELNDVSISEQPEGLLSEQERYDEVAEILKEVRDMLREFETLMQAPTYSNRLEYLRLYTMAMEWKGDLCRDLSSRRISDADSFASNEDAIGDLDQEVFDSREKADELWVKIQELSQ